MVIKNKNKQTRIAQIDTKRVGSPTLPVHHVNPVNLVKKHLYYHKVGFSF